MLIINHIVKTSSDINLNSNFVENDWRADLPSICGDLDYDSKIDQKKDIYHVSCSVQHIVHLLYTHTNKSGLQQICKKCIMNELYEEKIGLLLLEKL